MSSPKPPPAPDPYATSQAQTNSNVQTAIANSVLQNANEVSPLGSVNYSQTGTYTIQEPIYDKNGKITGYQPREVPMWTRTQTLSPEQQRLYNQQVGLAEDLNQFASNQLGQLEQTLSNPIDLDSLETQAIRNAPDAPQFATADPTWQGGDYEAYRTRAEDTLRQRLSPQLDRQYDANLTRLANQGIMPGSEAYREAVALADRQRNDAELAIISQAGSEVDRAYGIDRGIREDELSRLGFNNQYAQQGFLNELERGNYQNTARQQELQERAFEQTHPVSLISSLMGGGQPTMPQFTQYRPGTVQPTDVSGNVYRSYQGELNAYNQQLANQQAMLGGLFGLGSNMLMLI